MSKHENEGNSRLSISDWIQFLNNEIMQAENDEKAIKTMTTVAFSSMVAFLALVISMFSFYINADMSNGENYFFTFLIVIFAYISIVFVYLSRHNNKEIEKSRLRATISRSILYKIMNGDYDSPDDIFEIWRHWHDIFIKNKVIDNITNKKIENEYPRIFKKSKL